MKKLLLFLTLAITCPRISFCANEKANTGFFTESRKKFAYLLGGVAVCVFGGVLWNSSNDIEKWAQKLVQTPSGNWILQKLTRKTDYTKDELQIWISRLNLLMRTGSVGAFAFSAYLLKNGIDKNDFGLAFMNRLT